MRIKIIGDNNCARATRHLLRLGGFAVTEFLPADALAGGPLAGYAITIDLAPAIHSPDAHLRPDSPTLHARPSSEEADRWSRDASSSSFAKTPSAGMPAFAKIDSTGEPALDDAASAGVPVLMDSPVGKPFLVEASSVDSTSMDCSTFPPSVNHAEKTAEADGSAVAPAQFRSVGGIHFDSVDSELEAAVLRHVTQLAAAAVVVDRPGGLVHSDRELRIVVPNSGDLAADDAAAVAVEFGILRGLLDLSSGARGRGGPGAAGASDGADAEDANNSGKSRKVGGRRRWWPFGIILIWGALLFFRSVHAGPAATAPSPWQTRGLPSFTAQNKKPVLMNAGAFSLAQGQFETGAGVKITDGSDVLVVDPCSGQTKLFASINQTANTQLVSGTASKKIYVCSIHVVAAAAANVAVVEGTGSVCATGTAGVGGFGGATAATGWNFAANGGIAMGNGASSLGAEGTSGDSLCVFSSGSGQVSGGISYVVQ
ncbi:MAG TPA: hypothetical protein VKT71_01705 [Candidatus Acidoferrales bacterium]|nr:hypothetical protein [Candidatus Acidoferrales bacterium]